MEPVYEIEENQRINHQLTKPIASLQLYKGVYREILCLFGLSSVIAATQVSPEGEK